MWTPKDESALPTHGDITYAKEAICELEASLEYIVDITEKAKITRELETRKAWIAPMRKLPVEIMSTIFICNSEVDALGPITITEVCHRWRQIILNTPGAWCFIHPSKLKYPNTAHYISTFFERSNPYLLHFQVPPNTLYEDVFGILHPAELAILPSIHRFQCLKIGKLLEIFDLAQSTFSNLTRLSIAVKYQDIPIMHFGHSHFPRLEYLDLGRQNFRSQESGEEIIVPPLRYLSLGLDDTLNWFTFIKGCAATLKTLKISDSGDFERRPAPPKFQLTLPTLETFENDASMAYLGTDHTLLPIHIIAPKLRYYSDTALNSVSHLLLSDIDQIIYLRTADVSYIANYTALRELQLDLSLDQFLLPNQLAEELGYSLVCPALFLIQVDRLYEDWPTIQSMKTVLAIARPGIILEFPSRLSPIPGSMEELSCPSDMPCQVEKLTAESIWDSL